jgi:hypothetical protein
MLFYEIVDGVLLVVFLGALWWVWKHQAEVRARIIQNDGMPREASRGLVYGLILFLVVGFIMVHLYWLISH